MTMKLCVLGLGIMVAPFAVSAAPAPILSKTIAASANDLQRAVWACEAGAQALSPVKGVRFFPGLIDTTTVSGATAPLALSAGRLEGVGQMSGAKVWSNIRFVCTLSPALDRARTFTYTVLSPVKFTNKVPASQPTKVSNDRKVWYVEGTNLVSLVHGVAQTDNRDFLARCVPKSGVATVYLSRTKPEFKAGDAELIGVTAGGKSGLYVARGVLDDNLGVVVPVLEVPNSDLLTSGSAAATELQINIGAQDVYTISLKGSAEPSAAFTKACK
ncbi:MAG: hypothetical protein ABI898_11070 [Sphingomonadales bacterium]